MKAVGSEVTVSGRLVLSDGAFRLKDADGNKWTFRSDKRTLALMGHNVVVTGKIVAPQALKVLDIRRSD